MASLCVALNHLPHRFRLKEPSPQSSWAKKKLPHIGLKLTSKPRAQGNPKSLLRSLQDGGRQILSHDFFQQVLQTTAADFHRPRETRAVLQEPVVEQGGADLQAVGHADDIHLHHKVVRQVEGCIESDGLVDGVQAVGLPKGLLERVLLLVVGNCAKKVRVIKPLQERRREYAQPGSPRDPSPATSG